MIKKQSKIKIELIEEISVLKRRIQELEKSEARYKLAEEELRFSEVKFRALAESASTAIFLIQDTKYVYINPAFEKIVGYTLDDLADMNFWDFIHPDFQELVKTRGISRMQGEETPVRYELKIISKSGHVKWGDFSATLIQLDNKPTIMGSTIDTTDRKRAEQALRESQELYKRLVNTIPDIIVRTDLEGKILFVNDYSLQISGYIRDEVEGQNMLMFIAPEDRDRVIQNALLMMEGRLGPKEYHLIMKDGKKIPFEINGDVLRSEDGTPFGLVNVCRNITDRKRVEEEKRSLEERLQRAEKMEALGTLAGGVAHDLNNVLGIVVGYAELLLNSVDGSSLIRPGLLNIMKGGERAAAIVQDLLTLARRGVSGRQVLNLNKIIADCQRSPEFEKLSSYHPSVRIKTDLDPDLLNISGSSVHLGKTLFNLVSNASESMMKGGIVTIKTANEYLDKPIQGYDEVRGGDYVVLSMSDTGEGIPAADLKRIFEPFYTKKVMGRSGTGLGLAVVWGTVKDHNGYINVESEEGKGSTFTLYFPVTREDVSAEHVAVSISEYMGRGESVLVVDDVKGQRDLAAEMLQKLNYNVLSVSSGEEAVAYLMEHQVDLIVLDMIMDPGMDGLDTYRSILDIHPKQKAIIMSGFSETYRVNAAQALGTGAYVKKPYVIEKLGMAVKKELDRK